MKTIVINIILIQKVRQEAKWSENGVVASNSVTFPLYLGDRVFLPFVIPHHSDQTNTNVLPEGPCGGGIHHMPNEAQVLQGFIRQCKGMQGKQ